MLPGLSGRNFSYLTIFNLYIINEPVWNRMSRTLKVDRTVTGDMGF